MCVVLPPGEGGRDGVRRLEAFYDDEPALYRCLRNTHESSIPRADRQNQSSNGRTDGQSAAALAVRGKNCQKYHLTIVSGGEWAPKLNASKRQTLARSPFQLLTGRSSKVDNPLVLPRREGVHGKKGGGTLQHVVSGHVLWRGSDGHLAVVDDESDLGPGSQRVQVHAPVDQSRSQIAPPRAQRVGAQRHGSRPLVGFDELQRFPGWEEVQNGLGEKLVVVVIQLNVTQQTRHIRAARTPRIAQPRKVLQRLDHRLDAALHRLEVGRLILVSF